MIDFERKKKHTQRRNAKFKIKDLPQLITARDHSIYGFYMRAYVSHCACLSRVLYDTYIVKSARIQGCMLIGIASGGDD